jgi:hypothetical protein
MSYTPAEKVHPTVPTPNHFLVHLPSFSLDLRLQHMTDAHVINIGL